MSINIKPKIIAIVGPTATGKTDLAMELASLVGADLVACDSRQVYKGLDIGTGKLPGKFKNLERGEGYWVVDGVKIWGYDLIDPVYQYTLKDYIKWASVKIEELFSRGRGVVIVGGTGLYLQGLLEGLDNFGIDINQQLRRELQNLTTSSLQQKLLDLSPAIFAKLNNSEKNNPCRLVRKIELIIGHKNQIGHSPALAKKYQVLKIGLYAPKSILDRRIDLRVIKRVDQGMIDEARQLHKSGLSLTRMHQLGLEYGLLADMLEGDLNEAEFVAKLQTKSHQYAKRQMVWFKRDKEINWFDISTADWQQKVVKLTLAWYN